jgi:hypothetical protein
MTPARLAFLRPRHQPVNRQYLQRLDQRLGQVRGNEKFLIFGIRFLTLGYALST